MRTTVSITKTPSSTQPATATRREDLGCVRDGDGSMEFSEDSRKPHSSDSASATAQPRRESTQQRAAASERPREGARLTSEGCGV